MKSFILAFFASLCLMSTATYGQQHKGSLTGKAVDGKSRLPVEYVSFAVKNVKDSTIAAMGATTKEGVFSAKNLKTGQYKFYLAIIGYKPVLKLFEISPEKPAVDFGNVLLEEEAITLNSVLVKGDLLPMIIKKDTIEFNADAFKTQADASLEDALKTIPGMEIDPDGNMSFNGKKIDKVLVDGKDFFGNDPKMATRNLPKEIINKIQVIEKKTDEAIFKGIDDGKRENILNVTLKEDKKKGYFGNIGGGIGNGALYDASFNLNRFNQKRQFSVIGMANNINKSAFSFNDLTEFMGGDLFGSGMVTGISIRAGGSMSIDVGGNEFSFGSSGGGINDNKGLGLNYNDEWGKDPKYLNKVNLNYMVNRNYGVQQSLSSRLNLLGAESFFNDRDNDVTTTTVRHRFSMRLDLPLDSANKLQISPNFAFSGSDNQNVAGFNSYTQNSLQPINTGNSLTSNDSRAPAFGGKLIFNHRFKKRGRSFSFNMNGNYSHSVLDGLNFSDVTIYTNGVPSATVLDQLIDQTGKVNSYGLSFDFSEPLTKKITLGLSYYYNRKADLIDRVVYDYDAGVAKYNLVNTELSRDLQNFNDNNGVSIRFNYIPDPKYSFTFNSSQKIVSLRGRNAMNGKEVANHYFTFDPNLILSYKLDRTSSLSVSASRYTNTPNITQLQPLTDNSNPLQITTGNPNLKPSGENSFNLSYNKFNPTAGSSFNMSVNANSSDNRIINNTILDPKTGIQTTFYDNINGAYNLGMRLGGGFRIKSISLNPNINAGLGRNRSFLNGAIVSSHTKNLGLGTMVSYALGPDLQFSNRINFSRRVVSYDYNNLADQDFTTISNYLNLNVSLPYNFRFVLSSNLNYNANVTLGNHNTTVHMANVSMEKLFLNKTLTFKASVSDVFNNSRNTSRFSSDTYILESVNMGMRRYFLFSLNYRLRKFGEKTTPVSPLGTLFNF